MRHKLTAFLFACLFVGAVAVCQATGPRLVTFDQPADCEFVAGWELAYEPVSRGTTEPSPLASGFTVASGPAPLACGPGASFVFTAAGVGDHRFWIRAVSTDGTRSPYSNFLDAPVPFAAPVLRSVGP